MGSSRVIKKTILGNKLKEILLLEKQGRFEEAENILSELRNYQLEKQAEAEVNLRQGAVSGYLQKHSQSKNLLITALEFFDEQGDSEKTVECHNYLALAYWRTGELKEAKMWLHAGFSQPLNVSHSEKLHTFIIQGIINLDEKKFTEVITSHKQNEKFFLKFADNYLKGCFYNNLAVAKVELRLFDEAIENYERSHRFFVFAKHQNFVGIAENNLANLLRQTNDYPLADYYARQSRETFQKCGNKMREASVLDTHANIYFDQGNFEMATELIEKSIAMLKETQNHLFLLESYQTKIKILIAQRNTKDALCLFGEVYSMAVTYCGESYAKDYAGQINVVLEELTVPFIRKVFTEKQQSAVTDYRHRKLKFPFEMPEEVKYFGVEITNQDFKSLGLRKGMLAIVVEEKVETGDLSAVLNHLTGQVVIGYFEFCFGVIAIEIPQQETIFLMAEEAKVLGKVFGIGELNKDGEIDVKII